MNPTISFIIPVYNASKYLNRCFESILCQSYSDIEIILVDDGSLDNSLAICRKFAESDSRVIVVSQENTGVSTARNKGIDIAQGLYLAFVDADDWVDANVCETFVEALNYVDYDIFCYSAVYHGKNNVKSFLFGDDIPLLSQKQKDELHCKVMTPTSPGFEYISNTRFAGSVWGKFYKTKILKENTLRFSPETIISEDVLFNLLAMDYFEKIGYTTKAFYHYQINSTSAQNRYRRNSMKYFGFVIDEIQKWLVCTNKNQQYRDCANSLFVHYLFGTLREDLFHKDNPDKSRGRSELRFALGQEKYQRILDCVNVEYFSMPERLLISLLKNKRVYLVELLLIAYKAIVAIR